MCGYSLMQEKYHPSICNVQDGKLHVYVYLFNLFSIYKSKSASNVSSENVYNDE